MDNTKYTAATPAVAPARQVTGTPSALAMGGFGMIVGGSASAAANIRRMNNNEIDRSQAIKNVTRDSIGAGVATAAATAVVGALRLGGLFNIAGTLAVATAAKYLYDTAFEPQAEPATKAAPKPAAKPASTAKEPAKPAAKAKAKPAAKAKTASRKKTAPKAKPAEKKED